MLYVKIRDLTSGREHEVDAGLRCVSATDASRAFAWDDGDGCLCMYDSDIRVPAAPLATMSPGEICYVWSEDLDEDGARIYWRSEVIM